MNDNLPMDPYGKDIHESGAKVDSGKAEMSLITDGFALALRAVADVGTFGAQKYSRNGWQSVPDAVYRYRNAMHRHLNDHATGEVLDPESNFSHLAHAAWNALAVLELTIREEKTKNER